MAKVLRAIKANPGIRAEYRRRLEKLVDEMHASVLWWARAAYRKDEERIASEQAQDASPWRSMSKVMAALQRYWVKRWKERADAIAFDLVHKTLNKTRSSYLAAFKEAGMSVKMKPSRAVNDVVGALIAENVSLIKSIPERYFGDVTSMVQRHISQGKNIKALEDELAGRYDVTRNRAKFIARDQSDKASEALKRAECKQMGITEGIWVHVPGMKSARATHMKFNGQKFSLEEGLYDADAQKKVLPGELVNCFPGSTKLYGLPLVNKVYRRWYEGPMAEFTLSDGTILQATQNHPVLTVKGWKPAGLLDSTDYVVKSLACDTAFIGKCDKDGLIPTFEELYSALLCFGTTGKIPSRCSASDFHGDGIDGDIDVIDVDRLLADVWYPRFCELAANLELSVTEQAIIAHLFTGYGMIDPLFKRMRLGVSDARLLRTLVPFFFGQAGRDELLGLTFVASGDTSHVEVSSDNLHRAPKMFRNCILAYTALIHGNQFLSWNDMFVALETPFRLHNPTQFHVSVDSGTRNTEFGTDVRLKSSGEYHLLNVVNNRLVEFSGHVYNLQTESGFYLPQKLYCHNCRCTYRAVIPEFGDE